ncbi:MAG: hypothetical protein ACRDNS_33605 [Trebonia sp.]
MRRRAWPSLLVMVASIVTALAAVGASGSSDAFGASGASCGTVVVSPARVAAFYSVNRVTAHGASCAAARRLVGAWARAAQANKIPESVVEATAGGVIVYGRPGARYRFHGYTCRWTNTDPGKSSFLPGRGRCQAGSAVIAWGYRGQTNPSFGGFTGCKQAVRWTDGDANALRVHKISCARAQRTVSDALSHGLLRHSGGGILIARRVFDGFTFHPRGGAITARRGVARIDFYVCWYRVNC